MGIDSDKDIGCCSYQVLEDATDLGQGIVTYHLSSSKDMACCMACV